MGGQVIVHHPEGLGAVVVVGVDDRERTVDEVLCCQHGVAGAPGLDAPLRDGKACGQFVQLLEGVFHVHSLGHAVADGGLERRLDLMLDDEDHRLKACAAGVVERIVHDDLAVRAHRVDLLHAAVAAAHAGRHDHQYRFVHIRFLPLFKPQMRQNALWLIILPLQGGGKSVHPLSQNAQQGECAG